MYIGNVMRLEKSILFMALLCLGFNSTKAQEGYKINVTIQGLKDTVAYMAGYYGNKQYYKDTAEVNSNGQMVFEGDKSLPGGIYSIVLPDQKTYFEFILVNQFFSMETKKGSSSSMTNNLKVTGSKENDLFYSYMRFIGKKQGSAGPHRRVMEDSTATKKQKDAAREKLIVIDEEVKAYKENFMKENPTAFVSKVFLTSKEPEVPKTKPILPNGREDSTFPRRYYMSHFWDDVDFTDDRLLRSPVLHNKLEKYISKLTLQHPDSIINATDYLIRGRVFDTVYSKLNSQLSVIGQGIDARKVFEKPTATTRQEAKDNILRLKPGANQKQIDAGLDKAFETINSSKEIYKYFVHWITNTYEKSKVMCMDGVFVHMAFNYYLTGEAYWIDSAQTEKIRDRATKLSRTLCNEPTPNVMLLDTTELADDPKHWINLYRDVKTDYTVLVFWDPGCGHCKKEMPKLVDAYKDWQDKKYSVEVFSVCTEFETADWKKYIKKNEHPWINVSDNPEINKNAYKYIQQGVTDLESLNFRDTYDIFSTPRVFLLDKDKKVLAKRLSVDQLSEILDNLINKKKK
jgi:thiol-disulfide isomerase/thioredoxin